jgi:hypothetical protein
LLALDNVFSTKSEEEEPEVRSEMWDLLIFIFILKTTGIFTPVHSAGYLILRNEFRSTQEIARQNLQVSFYTLIYWRIKYLKLKYGLSLLKIHETYKKYIFRIIFYVSLIKNDKQKKEKKLTFLNHLLRAVGQKLTRSDLKVKCGIYLFLSSFWKRQVHSHRFTQQGT